MPDVNHDHARAIGEKLRAVRQHRRISLRDLARKADISASMLSQIETGKAFPSVRSIYGIAAALNVPVDYFFPAPNHNGGYANDGEGEGINQLTASQMRQAQVDRSVEPVPPAEAPARPRTPVIVMHSSDRPTIELNGGVTWARLTGAAEPDVEFIEIAYEPGASSGVNMSHHQGREFGLVLQGELLLELGFDTHRLSAGDSIIFDSTLPHRLSNTGAQTMRALWVVLSQIQP